jgi:hypothetical protein
VLYEISVLTLHHYRDKDQDEVDIIVENGAEQESLPLCRLERSRFESGGTAVYGPVRTVVWQGSAGDCRPYADQTCFSSLTDVSQRLEFIKSLPLHSGGRGFKWREASFVSPTHTNRGSYSSGRLESKPDNRDVQGV